MSSSSPTTGSGAAGATFDFPIDLTGSGGPVDSLNAVLEDAEAVQQQEPVGAYQAPSLDLVKKHINGVPIENLRQALLPAILKDPSNAISLVPGIKTAIEEKKTELSIKPGFNKLPAAAVRLPTLKKFCLFPRLPPEIRVMIWNAIPPRSRIISISLKGEGRCIPYSELYSYRHFKCKMKVPITLQVNRESRTEALKRFQLSFPFQQEKPSIYVDFSTDVIYFGSLAPQQVRLHGRYIWDNQMLKDIVSNDGNKIQYLSCSHFELTQLLSRSAFIEGFSGLKKIFVEIEKSAQSPIQKNYRTKLLNARWFVWAMEPQPYEEVKKQLIDRAEIALHKAARDHPSWKAPSLVFGSLEPPEYRERMATLEKDLESLNGSRSQRVSRG